MGEYGLQNEAATTELEDYRSEFFLQMESSYGAKREDDIFKIRMESLREAVYL